MAEDLALADKVHALAIIDAAFAATETALDATHDRTEGHALAAKDYAIAWTDALADAYEQLATTTPSLWADESAARERAAADRTAVTSAAAYQRALDQALADFTRGAANANAAADLQTATAEATYTVVVELADTRHDQIVQQIAADAAAANAGALSAVHPPTIALAPFVVATDFPGLGFTYDLPHYPAYFTYDWPSAALLADDYPANLASGMFNNAPTSWLPVWGSASSGTAEGSELGDRVADIQAGGNTRRPAKNLDILAMADKGRLRAGSFLGNEDGAKWGQYLHDDGLQGASLLADVTPVVGDVKGAYEAYTGADAFTGENLSWWQRALVFVPFLGTAGRRGANAADATRDALRASDNADDVLDAAKQAISHSGRSADNLIENLDSLAKSTPELPADLIGDYGKLASRTDIAGQAHHLNQAAAYSSVIPYNRGKALKLVGNIFTDAVAPHTKAHAFLESFWNTYRGTDIVPTNLQYTRALQQSLRAAGVAEPLVAKAVRAAIRERVQFGLLGGVGVPYMPRPIYNLAL